MGLAAEQVGCSALGCWAERVAERVGREAADCWEVASGEWRVASLKKKQIPRLRRPPRSPERTRKRESACSARNDNL